MLRFLPGMLGAVPVCPRPIAPLSHCPTSPIASLFHCSHSPVEPLPHCPSHPIEPLSHCPPSHRAHVPLSPPVPLRPCLTVPPSDCVPCQCAPVLNPNLQWERGTIGRRHNGTKRDGYTMGVGHIGTRAQWADPEFCQSDFCISGSFNSPPPHAQT